jgi:glycosyltransferase involved in cell wall biosynthesis
LNARLLLEILFWLSLFMIFWPYIGYFLALQVISLFHSIGSPDEDHLPDVSIVITAHNEQERIAIKIENTLALCYPRDKLEIIVVSDGSTDRTDEIVKSYEDKGVRLLPISGRRGKHFGQGRGIEAASGEIMVLSDATTFLKPDAVKVIVRGFADPAIGCVSGRDLIESTTTGASGEGTYVDYEMKLRTLESRVCSLVGASGSFFAIRKSLCQTWYPDMSSDFYLPLISYMRGFRTTLDTDAIGYYRVLDDPKGEFQRKVRTVVHGIDVLNDLKSVLNPFKYGFYSIQVASHKLIRWLVPFFLLMVFVLSLILCRSSVVYLGAFAAQLLLYASALAAAIFPALQKIVAFKVPYFFVLANLAILVAWYNFLTGQRFVTWQSTKR